MADVTKLSDIYPSLTVKISVTAQSPRTEIGVIAKVTSLVDNPKGIEVVIDGGLMGNVIEIIKSVEIAKNKILIETNYADNKLCFTETVMKEKAIPQAVQSFLNSQGGSLFIGVADDPKPGEEKIVGLQFDRNHYELKNKGPISDDKFKDKLRTDIEHSLETNLYSKIRLGQLVDYDWWHIDGKIFLEIIIPSAKAPVFYKHLYKTEPDKGKEIMFNLTYKEGHTEMKGPSKKLDEFFVREGSHKSPITTFEEYTAYYNTHFI
jgi:predicted HTH transcriptional regulator